MLEPFGAVLVRVIDRCADLYVNPRDEQGPPTLHDLHALMDLHLQFDYGPVNPWAHWSGPCTCWCHCRAEHGGGFGCGSMEQHDWSEC